MLSRQSAHSMARMVAEPAMRFLRSGSIFVYVYMFMYANAIFLQDAASRFIVFDLQQSVSAPSATETPTERCSGVDKGKALKDAECSPAPMLVTCRMARSMSTPVCLTVIVQLFLSSVHLLLVVSFPIHRARKYGQVVLSLIISPFRARLVSLTLYSLTVQELSNTTTW